MSTQAHSSGIQQAVHIFKPSTPQHFFHLRFRLKTTFKLFAQSFSYLLFLPVFVFCGILCHTQVNHFDDGFLLCILFKIIPSLRQ